MGWIKRTIGNWNWHRRKPLCYMKPRGGLTPDGFEGCCSRSINAKDKTVSEYCYKCRYFDKEHSDEYKNSFT